MKLIDKDILVAEIERRIEYNTEWKDACKTLAVLAANQAIEEDKKILSIIDTLEVKEVKEDKLPNPRFPHLDNIIEKVFGAGNLESFEYEEAEQLVLLAKEELLKDLEVKGVDLEKETDKWYNNEASKEFENVLYKDIEKCAKHFFKLGMQVNNKAQKGEEVWKMKKQ